MSELPGLDRRAVDGHPLLRPILASTLTRGDIKVPLVNSIVPGACQVAGADDPAAQRRRVPIVIEGLEDGERAVGIDGPGIVCLTNLTGIG
jgi:hypothetical protein